MRRRLPTCYSQLRSAMAHYGCYSVSVVRIERRRHHGMAEKPNWAIATSGKMRTAEVNLRSLRVDLETATVVTRDMVRYAKPDPDLFVEAARRLGTSTRGSYVVGDSIWDMIAAARCGALGIGLLS